MERTVEVTLYVTTSDPVALDTIGAAIQGHLEETIGDRAQIEIASIMEVEGP